MSRIEVGQVLEVAVEKGVYRGLGLARHEGQVVFVPRAWPGDRLRVRVESVRRDYVQAAAEAVLHPAPGRRESPCPYVPACGGCAYQELEYSAQLGLKQAILRESLERAGARWEGEIPLRASPESGWRLRASLRLGVQEARLALGLRQEGTHRVVDLAQCLQLSPRMNRAARELRDALTARPGLWRRVRGIDLLEAPGGDVLVAALDTGLKAREASSLGVLAGEAPSLAGLGVVLGDGKHGRFLRLHGAVHVEAPVLDLKLRAHVRSFFQANRFLYEELARTVVELAGGGGAVLDLYAGVGLFALPLARHATEVAAVELNPVALEDALANARRAGLTNVRFLRGDVLEALRRWPARARERIVLDPPRGGAGARVVSAITERRPETVVYVSCDPPTLGRDLAAFAARGYRADTLRAFDLFPNTFHLETVVRLLPG